MRKQSTVGGSGLLRINPKQKVPDCGKASGLPALLMISFAAVVKTSMLSCSFWIPSQCIQIAGRIPSSAFLVRNSCIIQRSCFAGTPCFVALKERSKEHHHDDFMCSFFLGGVTQKTYIYIYIYTYIYIFNECTASLWVKNRLHFRSPAASRMPLGLAPGRHLGLAILARSMTCFSSVCLNDVAVGGGEQNTKNKQTNKQTNKTTHTKKN